MRNNFIHLNTVAIAWVIFKEPNNKYQLKRYELLAVQWNDLQFGLRQFLCLRDQLLSGIVKICEWIAYRSFSCRVGFSTIFWRGLPNTLCKSWGVRQWIGYLNKGSHSGQIQRLLLTHHVKKFRTQEFWQNCLHIDVGYISHFWWVWISNLWVLNSKSNGILLEKLNSLRKVSKRNLIDTNLKRKFRHECSPSLEGIFRAELSKQTSNILEEQKR